MNWKKGFKRITLLISIVIALGVGITMFICFYNETKNDLPHNLESLAIARSLLEEKHSEVSAKLKEKSSILLKNLDIIELYKREISIRERKIPPKAYVYNSIWALSFSLGGFVSVWLAYYILIYFLKFAVFPLFKWLALGFCEDKGAN